MNRDEYKSLLDSQQGELDGVATYLKLAKITGNPSDAAAFKRLAADEGRHAAVFRRYTKASLKPGHLQERAVAVAYRLLGKRLLYPLIARFEYAAIPQYERMMSMYPETESVKNDEKRHGDTLLALRKNGEYADTPLLPIAAGGVLAMLLIKRVFR